MLRAATVLVILIAILAGWAIAQQPLPDDPKALLEICKPRDDHKLKSNYRRTVDACTRLIEDHGDLPNARYMGHTFRGSAYAIVGDDAAALADFRAAIALDDGLALAYLLRAEHYEREHMFAEAAEDYTAAMRAQPGLDVYLMRARAYQYQGAFDAAIADYRTAATREPNDAFSLSSIARIHLYQDDPTADTLAEALSAAEKAVARDRDAGTLETLGMAQAANGRIEAAVESYKQAIEMSDAIEDRYIEWLVASGYLETPPEHFTKEADAALRACLRDKCRLGLDPEEFAAD